MKKYFCIGHATYDMTLPVYSYPAENSKIKTNRKVECGGGSSANSSVLLSMWKEKAYFIGAVGNDYYGKRVIGAFKYHKVNTKYLSKVKNCYTSTSFIVSSMEKGKRTIITFKDSNLKMDNKIFVDRPDVILFDGEHLDNSLALIGKYPEALKIIDAGSVKEETLILCPLMDYVVCSKNFAEEISGKKIDVTKKQTITTVCKILEKKFDTKVVITLEEHGSFAKIENKYVLVPSITVKAVDSTGAGDIYHGAFTYFISKGYDLEKTMRLSNISGALSVTKIGSRFSIPALEEVLSYDK